MKSLPALLVAFASLAATPAVTAETLLPLPRTPAFRLAAGPAPATGACVADRETLCLLEHQIAIRVRFRNQRAGGEEGTGQATALSDRTGTFWFFREDNVELVVKALDGRHRNGFFWIFFGSLSDLEYWIEARAVATGETTTYYNPPGHLFGLADTAALGAPGEGEVCGTVQGLTCAQGFFCDLEGSCDLSDAAGTCREVSDACPEVFAPVCGCDGITYDNDCFRIAAGARKDHEGACGEIP